MKATLRAFCAAALLFAAHAVQAADNERHNYTATVTAVADGDTVRVTDSHGGKHKIRLAYIDAPELNQAHGQASRDALKKLLERRQVSVEVFDTDQYSRQVARISIEGRDINLLQLESGHAWHYRSIARQQQSEADYQRYEAAENMAKRQRLGLWKQRNPTAPWRFRRQNRYQTGSR